MNNDKDSIQPTHDDISASLEAIMKEGLDNPEPEASTKKRKKSKNLHKKWSKKRKIITAIITIMVLILVAVGVYAYILLNKATQVFSGNPTDILTAVELKEDTNGRSNILVFGTSEDDEGHSGAKLADSIMVISLDQDKNDAAMFSIPRDLWVNYGMSCSLGSSGKINATYYCGLEVNNNDENAAALAFTNVVGEVFDMDIQYYAKVDYGVITGVVDAIGGIDVDIYTDDDRGIYDKATNLTLPAGTSHLNGETALKLARARNAKGGYGLSRSNFDREKNQQRIVKAIQKQALNIGILADPQKTLGILNSLGDNISTNVTMSELRQVIDKAAAMGDDDIRSIDITDYLKTSNISGASVVIPTAGQDNYTALREYIQSQLIIDNGDSNGE